MRGAAEQHRGGRQTNDVLSCSCPSGGLRAAMPRISAARVKNPEHLGAAESGILYLFL